MQPKQLLAASGVTVAAGAVISLSFALIPPLTLLPPRPSVVDSNGNAVLQQKRPAETVSAAVTDTFERHWHTVTDDMPPMPVLGRAPLEGLTGGLVTQDTPQPEPQQSAALETPPARQSDVCTRHGLRRVDYVQNNHRYWRCADRR
ncbi:MAG TPA: hypothetical protein VKG24_03900 [Pseudolabrys sp.]|jgi:hypothetical protein|nr:hypothetical protein [Pseudolabrys sp.]